MSLTDTKHNACERRKSERTPELSEMFDEMRELLKEQHQILQDSYHAFSTLRQKARFWAPAELEHLASKHEEQLAGFFKRGK